MPPAKAPVGTADSAGLSESGLAVGTAPHRGQVQGGQWGSAKTYSTRGTEEREARVGKLL